MAIVALSALATAVLSRQYEEVRSLVNLEMAALHTHAPEPEHPYACLLRMTLKDFKEMSRDEVRTWMVALIGPLDEARRATDRKWEYVIVAQLDATCQFMQGQQ